MDYCLSNHTLPSLSTRKLYSVVLICVDLTDKDPELHPDRKKNNLSSDCLNLCKTNDCSTFTSNHGYVIWQRLLARGLYSY